MKILADAYGLHEQALRLKSKRMEVLSQNIANADTPKYKARDIDFKQAMGLVQRDYINTTHSRHFNVQKNDTNIDSIRYRNPLNASADGNTVELSIEQANYGKAAADYRATLMFIENKTASIKRALRGE